MDVFYRQIWKTRFGFGPSLFVSGGLCAVLFGVGAVSAGFRVSEKIMTKILEHRRRRLTVFRLSFVGQLGVGVEQVENGSHKDFRRLRYDCIAITAHASHEAGNPISQRA
jgi:hypothetical protein